MQELLLLLGDIREEAGGVTDRSRSFHAHCRAEVFVGSQTGRGHGPTVLVVRGMPYWPCCFAAKVSSITRAVSDRGR